jgi:outer membrane protein OmpA-like peptidoglycan-associated protein
LRANVNKFKEMKMKNEIRLALLCLAATSVPAFAQDALPQCGPANFDQSRNVFTIVKPAAGAVNQQCLLTVYPTGVVPFQVQEFAAFYPIEGTYVIELSGGGGGGGGGASRDEGGGGGGAGAAPSRIVQYLLPGVYKLTIGTGGEGGSANGGRTEDGNPTSLTSTTTGQLIAGFPGADVWTQRTQASGTGLGGLASAGGSSGGNGGDSDQAAQAGGASQTAGYYGTPGQAGSERPRNSRSDEERNAGGGGGGSGGRGGVGESANRNAAAAGIGNFGGGGGGGRGGENTADAGSRGGHGFIRLSMSEPAPQATATQPQVVMIVAQPEVVALVPVNRTYSLSTDTLFGFNKSTLSPEGEAKLDDVASKLNEVNVDSITDTGHADRLGPQEYNQKLSVSRAESVKTYLVSKGVQPYLISVAGMGQSQPLTSPDACKGPATSKVIACLQPDRRVDIEVRGSDKMVGRE